jgi:hypothetical protein
MRNKQQGAVLAFSLVMLLLLTLVSTSMIRQNKTQLNVASNAASDVQKFAVVESALLKVQTLLEPLRYLDEVGDQDFDGIANEVGSNYKHCQSGVSAPIDEGRTFTPSDGLPGGVTAKVMAVYCLSNYEDQGGGSFSGDEARCLYSANTRSLVPDEPVNNTAINIDACTKLNDPRGWTDGNARPDACQIEVYTLNVNIVDTATGTDRTVESKFLIDCSHDLNAHNCPSGVAPCPAW